MPRQAAIGGERLPAGLAFEFILFLPLAYFAFTQHRTYIFHLRFT